MNNSLNINDGRHFKNEFPDYTLEDAKGFLSSDNKIAIKFEKFLIQKINELVLLLNIELPNLSSKDVSVYTGLSGIAYFYFKLSKCNVAELNDISKQSEKHSYDLVRRSLRHLRSRPGSFMCDDTGPLTMSVLLDIDKQNIEEIIKMTDDIVHSKDMPDEILYGRSGYLVALLLLHTYEKNVSIQLIKKIFKAIVNSGLKLANLRKSEIREAPPLFYEWHDKPYLGAAHGISGIMFMLLQIYLNDSLSEIRSEIKNDIFEYVYPTIKFLSQLRLPSGNYPSSLGESSKRDVLIHWCHGAPGWVHMFIAAHKVFNDAIFLERIKEIGEVVWSRGLLHKGCGLCHGSAGNGYVFLALYKYTKEPKYLYRALRFAEWCTEVSKNRTREADRPFSLFEGLAGTLHFLLDCLDPTNAQFPVYDMMQ